MFETGLLKRHLTIPNNKEEELELDTNNVVSRFNKRIADITGLTMDTAELLQLGNYGVGGQYEPHWDHQAFPGSDNQWSGETGSRIG